MMRAALLALLALGCCGAPRCELWEISQDGRCEPYVAGDPVEAGTAWQPAPGTRWQWQLSGDIDTALDVDMFDLDLFDAPDRALNALSAAVVVAICYFSAGTVEDWRDDAGRFPSAAIGHKLPEWEGERWVDIMDDTVREIMRDRLDLAVERGCDGVEPDNVDGYANRNGLGLNATEQLDYNRFLADEAHLRGLSVGLKNDLDQLDALLPWFDWALNEECASFNECGRLSAFTSAGKAAFHVEYVDDWADAPAKADEICGVGPDLDSLVKPWDLDARRIACE